MHALQPSSQIAPKGGFGLDHSSRDHSELKHLAQRIGIHIGIFFAGGLVAFVYSYMPLHDAKNWKIDYLSERIGSKEDRIQALDAELAELKADSADKPDSETFKLLQRELVTTDKTIQDLESKLAKADRRIKELERSRNNWKSKHAALQAKGRQAPSPASEARVAEASTAAGTSGTPASLAPPGGSNAAGLEVLVGRSWASDDGKAGFDLVAIENGRAKIVPDPAAYAAAGGVPKVLEIEVGGTFRVGLTSQQVLRVRLDQLNGSDSIRVTITQ